MRITTTSPSGCSKTTREEFLSTQRVGPDGIREPTGAAGCIPLPTSNSLTYTNNIWSGTCAVDTANTRYTSNHSDGTSTTNSFVSSRNSATLIAARFTRLERSRSKDVAAEPATTTRWLSSQRRGRETRLSAASDAEVSSAPKLGSGGISTAASGADISSTHIQTHWRCSVLAESAAHHHR